MKCERCAEYRETAADVRGCVGCVQDGTAAQIPADVPDDTVLESLCVPDSGLANRFKRGSLPVDEDPNPAAEPTPEQPAPKKGFFKRLRGSK